MKQAEFEKAVRLASHSACLRREAQTGNRNFQHGYDARCPLCRKGIRHRDAQHEFALRKADADA